MRPAVVKVALGGTLSLGLLIAVRLAAWPLVKVSRPTPTLTRHLVTTGSRHLHDDSFPTAIVARDVFRLMRRPSDVAYDPLRLAEQMAPPAPKPATLATTNPGKAVKVISKPKPEYTAEARQNHIEGVVTIHIRVMANGAVEVVGVTKPLGYGLDESARRAILATKFEPATDASGRPVTWDGLVNVTFQLAG